MRAGAILSYVSMAVSTILSLVYAPIMKGQLGTSEYGVYGSVGPIIAYLLLLSMGLGSAYMRYYSQAKVAQDRRTMAKLNGMFLVTYTVLGLVLLVLGMCVSSVVGLFEKVISQLTIIMAFQSLILDMAGNVGTQSLAVTIRVLTDENITFKEKLSLVAKEMKIGFSGGVILGVISILFVGLYLMVFKAKTAAFAFAVSACIGAALLLSMVISSAVGTLIPLFFKKIKIDPAVASGPLITTINDLVAVVTYYGLSWILLINIMNLTG